MLNESSDEKESCGFLAGRRIDNVYLADEVFFVKNVSEDPNEFLMDPLDTIRVVKEIENRGKEIVALFHTHLGYPPIPSFKDLEGMDAWPVPWLIINKRDGGYKTWIKSDGRLDLIHTEIAPDS
ncbi:MAG: Mov34/MPN/PAD-1 family protein [Sulfolobales archaeon]